MRRPALVLIEGLTAAQIPATRRKRRRSHRTGFFGPARVTQEPLRTLDPAAGYLSAALTIHWTN
jgi:hypothetical protein